VCGDPPKQLIGGFDNLPVLAHEVPSAEHRKRIVGERREHVRTVRSAAWSRNRPRGRLAWLLLVVLLVLIAIVARADAAPAPVDDARELAIRYADILTGVDREGDATVDDVDDEDEDDDSADAALERDDEDDENDEDGATIDDLLDRHGDSFGFGRDDLADEGFEARRSDDLATLDDDAGPDEPASIGDAALDVTPATLDPTSSIERTGGGELALLDQAGAAVGIEAITGTDASFAAASAGAPEAYETWLRHQRPSRWGRLDFGVAWRRRWSEPVRTPAHRYEEVWLVMTWRR
jgi:hypothetical protein